MRELRRRFLWPVLMLLGLLFGLGSGWLLYFWLPVGNPAHLLSPRQNTTPQARIVPPLLREHWLKEGTRLLIPAIGVDAPVEPVGILPDGSMAVPTRNQWTGVGWFAGGTYPGEWGSAVLDGHLDRPGGAPAVFWNLHRLQIGDEVQVVESDGSTLRFRVRDVQKYMPQAAPLKKIFADTSGVYLNLITCAGQWIPVQRQTSQRLVVYTTLAATDER
ncbi:MAG: class F sortase [Ktedonobacteraceae bacterium]|nr:class F sortase [Ktedonobacteraceae bacterium]